MNAAAVIPECRPPFLLVRERLRDLFDGPDTFGTRFAIGVLVAEIKADPDTYGAGAVARTAAFLGQGLSRLYRYASVTECWTEAEAQHLLAPQRRGEQSLTRSHLVALASIDDRRERSCWTRLTCIESLSVRELAMRLARRGPRNERRDSLERVVHAVERFLAEREKELVPSWELVRCRETLDRALAIHESSLLLTGDINDNQSGGTSFDGAQYVADGAHEQLYLGGGMAHVVYDAQGALPAVANSAYDGAGFQPAVVP